MKKIFAIFSIFLIIFTFTVSVSAETETLDSPLDYQIYLSNIFSYPNVGFSSTITPVDSSSFYVSDFAGTYSGFYCASLINGHRYIFTFSASSDVAVSNVRFVPYDTAQRQPILTFDISTDLTFYTFDFVVNSVSDLSRFRFRINSSSALALDPTFFFKNINIFDVTGTDLTIDDLTHYIDLEQFYPTDQQFAHLQGFFDPYINFGSSLFHTFDFVPDLFTTYSALFVFVGAILSILFVIFIIVFMVKKFTGGSHV